MLKNVQSHEQAQALTDDALVAAYVKEERESSFGINYYLAQEMERRGYRDPNTARMTPAGTRALKAAWFQ